jgi:hypothetical protein
MNKNKIRNLLFEDVNDKMAEKILNQLSKNPSKKEFSYVLNKNGYKLVETPLEILPIKR